MSRSRGKIRAPRRGLGSNDLNFDNAWNIVSTSLEEIHTRNASTLSYEQLYRAAYIIVLKKNGARLYEMVQVWVANWLKEHVLVRIRELLAETPDLAIPLDFSESATTTEADIEERRSVSEQFISCVNEAWDFHTLCMNLVTDVLMYLDRVYCSEAGVTPVFPVSLEIFRNEILYAKVFEDNDDDKSRILDLLITVILELIRIERQGEAIDKTTIRCCINMLETLYEDKLDRDDTKLYAVFFEPNFLTSSRLYYQEEGARLMRSSTAPEFCRHTQKRLREEEERCDSMLSVQTEGKIKSVIDEEVIKANIREVMLMDKTGVKHMLDNSQHVELHNVFMLNSRVDPEKVCLKTVIKSRVVELGMIVNKSAIEGVTLKPAERPHVGNKDKSINQQTTAAINWVDEIILLKNHYDAIWRASFESDKGMQKALERSFADFINRFHRSSEFLSLFFDENLKKGLRGKTETEIDGLLEKGIILLRFIADKDMFETYYKKHLARRLLMKRSISRDAEQQMITKMKLEVGNSFTQRLEAMFKDMGTSEEISSKYKEFVFSQKDARLKRTDLSIDILTNTIWPVEIMLHAPPPGEEVKACRYPSQVEHIKQNFEAYYLRIHSGRRLMWQPSLGTADIKATFPGPKGKEIKRELNVSTYGMMILCLFNDVPDDESLSFEDIKAETNIPENDLIRNLQSLAVAPKTRILTKEPMSKDIRPTDNFKFNSSFHSPFAKIKVNVVAAGNRVENTEERKNTEKKVDEHRTGIIEAAIVRIMKQRKEFAHQQLITEVVTQLASRFSPDVNMIKKRIESLIEREYLERVEQMDPPAYRYLA